MKKSAIFVFAVITLVFAAFLAGFYIGRSTNQGPVEVSSRPPVTTVPSDTAQHPPNTSTTAATAGKVNINTASVEELQTLPGIGPVLAQRIVDYRMTYGYFRSLSELAKVEGIGEKRMEELLEYIKL